MKAIIGTDLNVAATLLKNGETVAIPTETVYGLAANALDIHAVTQIFEIKNRPNFDPLIVHIGNLNQLIKYVKKIDSDLLNLAKTFWPGPLTILFDKQEIIPDLVTSGLTKVAIRIPNHELTLKLLNTIDFPLAAPSANPFSYVSPTCSEHVMHQLGHKISYILDGGACQIGLESTIVGKENDVLIVYRKGGLELEKIKKVYGGDIIVKDMSESSPAAPGMLKKHYSPKKRMLNFENFIYEKEFDYSRIGFLLFDKKIDELPAENQFILSTTSDLKEAAQRLFAGLRFLDSKPIESVYIQFVPDENLGLAINDRLRRTLH